LYEKDNEEGGEEELQGKKILLGQIETFSPKNEAAAAQPMAQELFRGVKTRGARDFDAFHKTVKVEKRKRQENPY